MSRQKNLPYDCDRINSFFWRFTPDPDIEIWIVNTIKVRMVTKLEKYLEFQGRENLRKLFLVPVFSLGELIKRVEERGPEIKTLFYKELDEVITQAESRFEI